MQQPQVFNAAAKGIQCSSHRYSMQQPQVFPLGLHTASLMQQLQVFNAAVTGIQCSSHRYSMKQLKVFSAAAKGIQ